MAVRRKRPPSTPKSVNASSEQDEGATSEEIEAAAASLDEAEPTPAELVEADEIEESSSPFGKPLGRSVTEIDLSRADPLQRYMAEVRRHPLLTREEEHALAIRFREGDLKAAYRLVASNLRLVVKLAHEYHRHPLSLLDLIQEGNIGLMQAVKKYDPDRGVKLSSYAAWWIRAYVLRYIMDNWKMVKLGTTEAQRKLFFKLRQEQERLLAQGFEASPKLLAERLSVTEQDVIEMDQRLGHDEVSLDLPAMGPDGESRESRVDRLLPSAAQPADERLANEELKQIFREKLGEFSKSLKDKERYIFEHRLMADEPMTLQEIGDQYGFSRERARQIEAALIGRIREYLREQIPDFDLVANPRGEG
jgi:RNA polymerase sigma-32 factor